MDLTTNRFKLPEGLRLANLDGIQNTKMDNSAGSGLTALFASQIDDSLTFDVCRLCLLGPDFAGELEIVSRFLLTRPISALIQFR